MRTSTKLKLGYVALAAIDTWLSGAEPRLKRARAITKPLLMPTLAASVITNPDAQDSPLLRSTLAAQAAGWGGDIGLLGEGTVPFLAGTSSFGAGHLAYIAGFRGVRRDSPLTDAGLTRGLLASGGMVGPALGVAAARKDARLGPAVTAYAGLLSTMAAHANHLSPAQPRLARQLTAAGALTFLASDSILGVRKFVMKTPPPWMERTVMATYTTAQLLLAEGAVRAR